MEFTDKEIKNVEYSINRGLNSVMFIIEEN